MRFHGTCALSPARVRERLGAFRQARLESWASGQVLAASSGAFYCRVDGERFSLSQSAGMTVFDVIGEGEIRERGEGSELQLRFTLGAFPTALPPAALAASLPLAALAVASGDATAMALAGVLTLALGGVWFGTRASIRWMVEELSRIIGDVEFSRTAPRG